MKQELKMTSVGQAKTGESPKLNCQAVTKDDTPRQMVPAASPSTPTWTRYIDSRLKQFSLR